MKKIGLFLTSLLLVLSLTSCLFTTETSIEISELPKSIFEITDENNVEGTLEFTLKVLENGNEKFVLSYPNDKDLIKVTNFDTTKNAGTYTAIVEYDGIRVSFQYKLVSPDSGMYEGQKLFTSGTGTAEDPYMITTSTEFLNINKVKNYSENVSYILGNDLDFNGVQSDNSYYFYWFKGNIDGQGHMIKNLGTGNATRLFEYLSACTISNVNIHSTGYFVLSRNNKATSSTSEIVLKNVDRYGECQLIDENNFGFYFTYACGGYITFEDCDNYANIYGTSPYAAAYVGFASYSSKAAKIKFVNCHNYGIIEGQRASMFAANGSKNYIGNVEIQNCSNKGEIRGTINAQLVYATGKDDSTLFDDATFIKGGSIKVGSRTITVKNVTKGSIRLFGKISGITVTFGTVGSSKIQVKCTDSRVASVLVFGTYYGKASSGTLMHTVYETLKGFADAENNTVTANRLYNAQVKGCSDAEIEELLAKGYTFVNSPDTVDATAYSVGDEFYYLHSNTSEYKVSGVATISWSYVAFDAQGNLIGGGSVN